MVGAGEKILLFRHQPASEQLLHRLTDHDELQQGDLIEVVIAGQGSGFDIVLPVSEVTEMGVFLLDRHAK